MILAARNLDAMRGTRTVLRNVSLQLRAGEVVALLGPNGAGKTSLLRALAGLDGQGRDRITLDGRPIAAIPAPERARRLAYLAQRGDAAWPLTADRVVMLGRLPHRGARQATSAADHAAVATALAECGVAHLAARRIDELSGGEQARVLLARALAGAPDVLLADEPLSGLDPRQQWQVLEVLRARARAGMAVLLSLHDLDLAMRHADRAVIVADGGMVADGPVAEVLTPARIAAIWGMRAERRGESLLLAGPA